jgi:hypothetical protein
MTIGNDDLRGGNWDAAQTKLANRARDKRSREAFADSGDGIERAGRQLAKQRRAAKEPVQFVEHAATHFGNFGAPLWIAYQSFESRLVLRAKLLHEHWERILIPFFGAMRGLD